MKTILVVEDEESIRDNIVELLENEQFLVVQAHNGLVGLRLARTHLPDLVLCDVMMPEFDGLQMLGELRKNASTAAIPFILLTARAEKMDLRQGMNLGADDYLTKPFTQVELLGAITARLSKQEAVFRQSEQKLEDLRSSISHALPHELLTPLNGILGCSSLLVEEYRSMSDEEVIECLQAIDVSAIRLHRLIKNFLVYAQIELLAADPDRLEALRRTCTATPSDVIVALALHVAEQAGRQTDLTLDITDSTSAIVRNDLVKIAEELLDNAFKYSQAGTPVQVTMVTHEQSVLLSVTNYGRAMTPEQVAGIGAYMQFERKFYEQQGMGLGLTIAKRLSELHGGQLTIESAPTRTTVRVTLRAAQDSL
ncbi:MAG: response regulator [Gemmatimonadaceae bacterium]|nr:response regulator [Gloeobacterales cyanobacterium ES-bin-141]